MLRERREAEFVEFVAARRARLLRTAYLLTGDVHRAEDVVQTALTKVYVAWSRVRRADSVDAYVRRAVVNAHLDATTRPWRREHLISESLPERGALQAVPSHDDDLFVALQALAPGQRRIVVLRHYWGLSVEEVATDLDISTGTVKRQTHLALAHLRRALTPDDAERGTR